MSTCRSSSYSSRPRRKTTGVSSLPPDLLRNVLSRLPTIPLLKLRSVCREWRYIVDDPDFAAAHATSGVENPRILLLPEPSRGVNPRPVVGDALLTTSLPKWVVNSWRWGAGASCPGLLCFDNLGNGATYLLNPLTREIVLVASVAPRKPRHRIAIGVDRLTSRFKIPRLNYFVRKGHATMRAEVLDQGSRSWRDIASAPPSGVDGSPLLGDPVFAAGSIHWRVCYGEHAVRITSFDLTKGEFAPTPCPELRRTHLVDLRGVLGLVDLSREESVDVWVMEESGLWVKEYRISQRLPWRNSHRLGRFLGCGGTKMVLMFLRSFLCYDPATAELEYVKRGGASIDRVVGSITVSLLSPAKLWNRTSSRLQRPCANKTRSSFGTSYL